MRLLVFLLFSLSLQAQRLPVRFKVYSQGYYYYKLHMSAVVDPVHYPTLCDTVVFALIDPMSGTPACCFKTTIDTAGYGMDSVDQSFLGQQYIPYVRFRNTLGVYSRAEVTINAAGNYFDLTDTGFTSYNCNQDYGVSLAYSGDMNQDGVINPADFYVWDPDMTSGAMGYLVTDLNGDSFVDAADYPFFDMNNSISAADPYHFNCFYSSVSENALTTQPFKLYSHIIVSQLIIFKPENNKELDIIIYDSMGHAIISKKLVKAEEIMDIGQLASGLYFICAPEFSISQRCIKL